MRFAPARRREFRDGLSLAGFIVVFWFFVILAPRHHGFGYDALAYWDVQFPDLYSRSFGQVTDEGAFRYSPVIGLLMTPFHALPFWLFVYLWTVVQVVALVFVARRWSFAACAWIGVPISIYEGNVDLLIAVSVVLGMRYPAAWAFALLTKPTSAVGLLWFLVRGRWRPLVIAAGVPLLIAAPTIVIWPDVWAEWLRMLSDNARHAPPELIPLGVRLPLAAAVVIYAARTNRLWLVGIGVALAQPALALRASAVAVAAIGLQRESGRLRAEEVRGSAAEPSGTPAVAPDAG